MFELLIFFVCFFLLLSYFKFVGLVDPLLRELIWPLAGSVFLLFNPSLLFTKDGIFFIFSLIWVVLLSAKSTPSYISPKVVKNAKTIFVLKATVFLGLILTIADFYFNFDISSTVYSASSFDARGGMSFSFIRFIKDGMLIPLILSYFIFKNTNQRLYFRMTQMTIVINLIVGLLNPSKGFLVYTIFLLFNFLYFNQILSGNPLPSSMLSKLKLRRSFFRKFNYLILTTMLTLFLTVVFIANFLGLTFQRSIDLIVFRLFDASYDFSFSIIKSNSVSFDFNEPPPEFGSIIELWLKPILKAFGAEYTHDTIPKYIEPILYGRSTFGISSPNSNLSLELTSIHGLFLGSLLLMFVTGIGFWLRRIYLQNSTVDLNFVLFIPIIMSGPMFCFQSGQSFFASYIPYVFIILALSFAFDILYQFNLLKKHSSV